MYPKRTEREGYTILTIDSNGTTGLPKSMGPEEGIETAIIHNGSYYILNGDWHELYEGCNSLEEVRALFLANQDKVSGWSDDWSDPI